MEEPRQRVVDLSKASDHTPRSQLPKSGYWYKTLTHLCVLCGRESGYRVRIYDRPKPDDWQERFDLTEEVCNNCRISEAF